MKEPPTTFEYWRGPKDGLWYWHALAENGEIIYQGQGLKSARGATKAIRRAAAVRQYLVRPRKEAPV